MTDGKSDTTPSLDDDYQVWARLKRLLGVDFHEQAVAEVRREEDVVSRKIIGDQHGRE